jgi:glucose/arabinose dehydrogenase
MERMVMWMMHRWWPLLVVLLISCLLAACNEGTVQHADNSGQADDIDRTGRTANAGDTPGGRPGERNQGDAESEPGPPPEEEEGLPRLQLTRVFPQLTFQVPVGLVTAPGDDGAFYVIEKQGRIRRISPDGQRSELFLDIGDRVVEGYMEEGLLGLAFHPDYPDNGYFYVNYTTEKHTIIARYQADVKGGGAADPSTEMVLLTYEQPYNNHNGGDLHFGPDGMLYIASGDGGGRGDPRGNGQNLRTLLGKILRIDVDRAENGQAYAIPEDNPFSDLTDGTRQEIYAYGLRNPWRFSFDAETGELWAADVGQDKIEEINVIVSGGNYGWNIKEGTRCYARSNCADDSLIDPVYEYDHSLGQSITGGYVYRGARIPALVGRYVYADFVSGRVWALKLEADGQADNVLLLESGLGITSFGVDEDGELYVTTIDGGIYQFTAAD